MTIRLHRDESASIITLIDEWGTHLGDVSYTRRIHKHESDADLSSLRTQLNTYGVRATIDLFEYLRSTR